jgi:hypothetical protein
MHGARFLLESADAVTVGCKLAREHLDRHIAPEARVAR